MNQPFVVNSISHQHQLLNLPAPEHPLISVIRFEDIKGAPANVEVSGSFYMNFYSIAIKDECRCTYKYGQNYYDFEKGIMSFTAPRQLHEWIGAEQLPPSGWLLTIHPDLLRGYPLGQKIKEYGFFHYAVNEALMLSAKEEKMVDNILKNIKQEYRSVIDNFSQDVIISHIELLLNYSNRFYNRQFITRKHVNHDLLAKFETLLTAYIDGDQLSQKGLPTVKLISEQMNMSPNYLSDMLKKITGQSTQQHIHNLLIERSKDLLTNSGLTVSEIAYHLGFEYPQSFSKLFKQKTNISPLEFRTSFN